MREQSDQGDQGIQGPAGETGEQGEKGDPGATGPTAGRWPEKLIGTWRNDRENIAFSAREITISHDEAGSGETIKFVGRQTNGSEDYILTEVLIIYRGDRYWTLKNQGNQTNNLYTITVNSNELTFVGMVPNYSNFFDGTYTKQ